ncbi:MAG: PadR family transcriptional regulator, partial [Chloroflexota bacterium]
MTSISKSPKEFLPLTPVVFHILMALSTKERHGYAIIKQVEISTESRVKIQTGTLYQAIKRLLAAEIIEEV